MATNLIGQRVNRIDGRAKVTGRANYAADNALENVAHAVGVFSTIGAGRVEKLDLAEAQRSPGVLGVWHHGNFPKVYRSPNDMQQGNRVGEVRPPFEDDGVYYAGQFVAVVVAETFEQARAAARLVRVTYREEKPAIDLDAAIKAHGPQTPKSGEQEPDSSRGDPEGAWNTAAVKIDATYTTPVEVHNPMELHAAIAVWNGDKLEVHDSTQWVVGQRKALAKMLGIPAENVTVLSPYIGGGFGGKLFLWPHSVIAAVTARELKRPVKLVLERKNEFTTVGHRPATRQRMRLGATPDGKLVSVRHDTHSDTSLVHDFMESCGETTRSLYSCPNLSATHRIVPAHVGTPTSMRAPGAASGTFALECAMDELAVALKIDPLELRLRNYSERDEHKGRPWSSKYLRDCYASAADRFGWKRRNPVVGSMRDGAEVLGWGMATASWPGERGEATVRVELRDDGSARVSCATQDIGTGTYTVIAQVAAEVLGVPLDKVQVAIGSSAYPEGPISGGSRVTATVVPAVAMASRKATESLIKAAAGKKAPFAGEDPKKLSYRDGAVVKAEGGKRATTAEILKTLRLESVEGEATSTPSEDFKKHTSRCFGAHFVEVRWDPGLAHLRVSRVVSAFDVGRVINHKTATNQIHGSIVMGLGMARLEESVYDHRTGRVLLANVSEYLLPVNADTPEMDIQFIDKPDPLIGEFGARGIGEIGITGIAGAIANAIYHATGKRVRDLPITTEKLL
jgi:xanthine dehydrogenase YagR molybdenum-binding subunit